MRGTVYTLAFFSAKHLGESQCYLLCGRDKTGKTLEGKTTYRLRVPANAPVTQYWSVTVYDRETHAFIRRSKRAGRSSQTPGLQTNPDGSADIFFGPKPPAGKKSNWIPTDAKGGFEVLARFYGPRKPLFDKTWRLPDIEKTKWHRREIVHRRAGNGAYPSMSDCEIRMQWDHCRRCWQVSRALKHRRP